MNALIQSLRLDGEAAAPQNLGAALSQVADWERFKSLAVQHGVFPSLYRRLAALSPAAAPPNVLAAWGRDYRIHARRNLRLTGELLRVLNLFASQGVTAIPLKGPLLAQTAYGDPALRQFIDLDILVRPRDLGPARELLLAAGYRYEHRYTRKQELAQLRRSYDLSFLHPERAKIELHWRLLDHQGGELKAEAAFTRRVEVSLVGKTVASLHPQDQLLFVCVHAGYHRYENLGQVLDVARLLTAYVWDWGGLLQAAKRAGLRRWLLLGWSLAHGLLGARLPEEFRAAAQRDRVVQNLHEQVTNRLRHGPGKGSGMVARNLWHLKARERLRDKLAYAWSRLGVPNEDDWQWVQVPDSHHWLYYGLRPARLLSQGLFLPMGRKIFS